jgi:Family of unknown function (DUF5317)
MTITVGALLAGVAIGLLTGGRPRNVATHHLTATWLLVVGVLLHLASGRLDLGPVGTICLLAGYGCLLVFAALNQTLVGMGIVALGLAANALVIAANGAMPVRPDAVVAAHITDRGGLARLNYGRLHHRESSRDRLRPLGDIIPAPGAREVVSFGDLILAVGTVDLVVHLLHPRHRRRRRPTVPPLPPLPSLAALPAADHPPVLSAPWPVNPVVSGPNGWPSSSRSGSAAQMASR